MKNISAFLFMFLICVNVFSQTNLTGQSFEPQTPEKALTELQRIVSTIPTDQINQIKSLATLHGGRIKPFDTLARENILFLTGKYNRWGLSAVQIYIGLMISNSAPWVELIEIRDPEIRSQLGFLKTQRIFSVVELESSQIEAKINPILQKQQQNPKSLNEKDKAWLEIYGQMSAAHAIITGDHLLGAIDFSHALNSPPSTISTTKEKLIYYLNSLKNHDSNLDSVTKDLVNYSRTQAATPELYSHYIEKIDTEVFYNSAEIFFWAGVLYLLMGTCLFIPEIRSKLSKKNTALILLIPLFVQIMGLSIRVYITRFSPVTNMYGTMIWVSMGVNLFNTVLFALYGNQIVSGFLFIASGLILLLTHSFPLILSPDLDPIVAVLRNNFWLSTHVTTITISYAAFTIAMVLGNITLVRSLFQKNLNSFLSDYAKYTYRMVQLGCFLLTVGIILGGIWADYSWGRFWGWDPKETWALIADLGFLSLLHARFIGWAPEFIFVASAPLAYLMVIMAWYGVNFILAAGLHSYGFSSGGATAVVIFVSLQLLLFTAAIYKHKIKQKIG